MVDRKLTLIATIALGVFVAPLVTSAQPAAAPAIGLLGAGTRGGSTVYVDVLRKALRERGYVDARSVRFEERWAEGQFDRLPGLASELVRLKVDVMIADSTPAALAAKRATSEIPIVFTAAGDPVGQKLVESLARPGGNVTGLSIISPELGPKRLELIKEAIPKVTRVAYVVNRGNPVGAASIKPMEDAARSLKLDVRFFDVRHPAEIDTAFADMSKQRVGAVVISADVMIKDHLPRIFALTMKYRLPAALGAVFPQKDFFLAYGIDAMDNWPAAAVYVDKILKGARPADLPVEQPTKFRLVVNLKTAKALGLTIPPSLLLRADQVIE
jgi:ABC-type uncharacterized transport system substrate-binding protein